MKEYSEKSSDIGPLPYVANIPDMAMNNRYFRRAVWTGNLMQLTIMCIPVSGEIGAEMHDDVDQMVRVECGHAMLKIGSSEHALNQSQCLSIGDVVFVPKGTWHNIMNIGGTPLKVSSIYAPVQHPKGTIHMTKEDSDMAHMNEHMMHGHKMEDNNKQMMDQDMMDKDMMNQDMMDQDVMNHDMMNQGMMNQGMMNDRKNGMMHEDMMEDDMMDYMEDDIMKTMKDHME